MDENFNTEATPSETPTNAFAVKAPETTRVFGEGVVAGFQSAASLVGGEAPQNYYEPKNEAGNTYAQDIKAAVNTFATQNAEANTQNIQQNVETSQSGVTGFADKVVEGIRKAELGINHTIEGIGEFGKRCEEKKKHFREMDARVSASVLSGISKIPATAGEVVGVASAAVVGVVIAPGVLAYGIGKGAYELGKDLAIKGIELAEKGKILAVETGRKFVKGVKDLINSASDAIEDTAEGIGNVLEITGRGFKSAYLTEATKVGIANGFGKLKMNFLTGIANNLDKKANASGAPEEESSAFGKWLKDASKGACLAIKEDLVKAKDSSLEKNKKRSLGLQNLQQSIVFGTTR